MWNLYFVGVDSYFGRTCCSRGSLLALGEPILCLVVVWGIFELVFLVDSILSAGEGGIECILLSGLGPLGVFVLTAVKWRFEGVTIFVLDTFL